MINFGIFNAFWNGQPNHLPFLSLYETENDPKEWNLSISIKLLDHIISTNSKESIDEGVKLLLKSQDWRPHLVASLIILKLDSLKSSEWINRLWERLRYGSWVSPQILVILSIVDHNFLSRATDIIDNGFQVTYSNLPSAIHHSARGPAGPKVAEKKIIAAAQYLTNGSLIDSDESDGGRYIAMGWKSQLLQLIQEKKFRIEK